MSLPAWERELKCLIRKGNDIVLVSLPAWERELKFLLVIKRRGARRVAPRVGA